MELKDTLNSTQQARREFLEKAGKLAAYTPPTIMLLMYPGAHAIASGGSGGSKKPKKPK
jgi:formiminotetrahydrofolate cyclodeaminase